MGGVAWMMNQEVGGGRGAPEALSDRYYQRIAVKIDEISPGEE